MSTVYHTEAKPQCWRAVAIFEDRPEALLYLHRSSPQVRAGVHQAFFDVLDDEERSRVQSISLQRWNGAPDAGRWQHQSAIPMPVKEKMVLAA